MSIDKAASSWSVVVMARRAWGMDSDAWADDGGVTLAGLRVAGRQVGDAPHGQARLVARRDPHGQGHGDGQAPMVAG